MTQLNSRKSIHNPTSTINKNTQWINNVTYWGANSNFSSQEGISTIVYVYSTHIRHYAVPFSI